MRYFALNIEARAPLAIRSDHAAVGAGNFGYIAGSALAGSLASVYRFAYPDDTAMFERLFLSGQVHYPDLAPAVFKSRGMHDAVALPVSPLPQTAQTCKRFQGFRPIGDGDEDDEGHGARDTLLDWAVFELGHAATLQGSQQPIDDAALLQPLTQHKHCHCGRPMDHFSGYYRRDASHADKPMSRASLDTRLQTHTGINRDTGTVEEGILYHRRVFEEQTRFWGLLKVADDLADPLTAFIEDVGLTGLVRIGTSRTRGMGKVHLSLQPLDAPPDRFGSFKQRLRAFSTRLRDQAKEAFPAGAYDLALDPFYFALTLHSPLILRDDLLRYRGVIDEQALHGLLRLPADTLPAGAFRLLHQAASTRRVSGWNDLWGTPRINEYAIDAGSVFLFACKIAPDEVRPAGALWQALFTLEDEGAGRRRAEGFGRISVSDPFHLEVTSK